MVFIEHYPQSPALTSETDKILKLTNSFSWASSAGVDLGGQET